MAAINVIHQSWFSHPALGDEAIGIHRVQVNDTSNAVLTAEHGTMIDADVFQETAGVAVNGTVAITVASNTVDIQSGTLGDRYTIVTRHKGVKNG